MAGKINWFAWQSAQWTATEACLDLVEEGLYARLATFVQLHGQGGALRMPRARLLALLRCTTSLFERGLGKLTALGAVRASVEGDEIRLVVAMVEQSERYVVEKRKKDSVRHRGKKSEQSPGDDDPLPRNPLESTDSDGSQRRDEESALAVAVQGRAEPDPESGSGSADALASLGCLAPGSSAVAGDPAPAGAARSAAGRCAAGPPADPDARPASRSAPLPPELAEFVRWHSPEAVANPLRKSQARFVAKWPELIREWRQAFPRLDVLQALRQAYAFEGANPAEVGVTPRMRPAWLLRQLERAQGRNLQERAARHAPVAPPAASWPAQRVPEGCRPLAPRGRAHSRHGDFGPQIGAHGGYLRRAPGAGGEVCEVLEFVDAAGGEARRVWHRLTAELIAEQEQAQREAAARCDAARLAAAERRRALRQEGGEAAAGAVPVVAAAETGEVGHA